MDYEKCDLDTWKEIIEEAGDVEAKAKLQLLLGLERLILSAQEAIARWLKKIRTTAIGNIGMETKTKTRSNPIISFLLIISLWSRSPRNISVIKVIKEAIQPLGLILLR